MHAAQGKTEDIVLAHGESFRQNLTHQQSFYVSISRARYEAHIYTDDKEQYLATLNRFTGEKSSALGDIQKIKDLKNENMIAAGSTTGINMLDHNFMKQLYDRKRPTNYLLLD